MNIPTDILLSLSLHWCPEPWSYGDYGKSEGTIKVNQFTSKLQYYGHCAKNKGKFCAFFMQLWWNYGDYGEGKGATEVSWVNFQAQKLWYSCWGKGWTQAFIQQYWQWLWWGQR